MKARKTLLCIIAISLLAGSVAHVFAWGWHILPPSEDLPDNIDSVEEFTFITAGVRQSFSPPTSPRRRPNGDDFTYHEGYAGPRRAGRPWFDRGLIRDVGHEPSPELAGVLTAFGAKADRWQSGGVYTGVAAILKRGNDRFVWGRGTLTEAVPDANDQVVHWELTARSDTLETADFRFISHLDLNFGAELFAVVAGGTFILFLSCWGLAWFVNDYAPGDPRRGDHPGKRRDPRGARRIVSRERG